MSMKAARYVYTTEELYKLREKALSTLDSETKDKVAAALLILSDDYASSDRLLSELQSQTQSTHAFNTTGAHRSTFQGQSTFQQGEKQMFNNTSARGRGRGRGGRGMDEGRMMSRDLGVDSIERDAAQSPKPSAAGLLTESPAPSLTSPTAAPVAPSAGRSAAATTTILKEDEASSLLPAPIGSSSTSSVAAISSSSGAQQIPTSKSRGLLAEDSSESALQNSKSPNPIVSRSPWLQLPARSSSTPTVDCFDALHSDDPNSPYLIAPEKSYSLWTDIWSLINENDSMSAPHFLRRNATPSISDPKQQKQGPKGTTPLATTTSLLSAPPKPQPVQPVVNAPAVIIGPAPAINPWGRKSGEKEERERAEKQAKERAEREEREREEREERERIEKEKADKEAMEKAFREEREKAELERLEREREREREIMEKEFQHQHQQIQEQLQQLQQLQISIQQQKEQHLREQQLKEQLLQQQQQLQQQQPQQKTVPLKIARPSKNGNLDTQVSVAESTPVADASPLSPTCKITRPGKQATSVQAEALPVLPTLPLLSLPSTLPSTLTSSLPSTLPSTPASMMRPKPSIASPVANAWVNDVTSTPSYKKEPFHDTFTSPPVVMNDTPDLDPEISMPPAVAAWKTDVQSPPPAMSLRQILKEEQQKTKAAPARPVVIPQQTMTWTAPAPIPKTSSDFRSIMAEENQKTQVQQATADFWGEEKPSTTAIKGWGAKPAEIKTKSLADIQREEAERKQQAKPQQPIVAPVPTTFASAAATASPPKQPQKGVWAAKAAAGTEQSSGKSPVLNEEMFPSLLSTAPKKKK
eukprot:TRINITY_DN546_c0_g1_i2.p1 TRINITY_DN546_c0_g1~~TRINITY_DN546_c0_g1_i2.p1  ORF type:complete len:822 (+),score=298.72 TRINITY_DN546_c0_g1_i2:28-2466(+)